jgi:RNA polymerase sigma-70 factor, ECF subfamily
MLVKNRLIAPQSRKIAIMDLHICKYLYCSCSVMVLTVNKSGAYEGGNVVSTAVNSLNQDGLAAIFEEYAPAIYKYLLRLEVYPLEADQIVGDVFARLLEKIAEGRGPNENQRAYLFQIAYHLVVDRAREGERIAPLEAAVHIKEEMEPVQSLVEERLLLDRISNAMEHTLTKEQRNVIVLRFQEGFSLKETAEITGTNVNAVKALQNRGINRLRQAMGRLNQEQF